MRNLVLGPQVGGRARPGSPWLQTSSRAMLRDGGWVSHTPSGKKIKMV